MPPIMYIQIRYTYKYIHVQPTQTHPHPPTHTHTHKYIDREEKIKRGLKYSVPELVIYIWTNHFRSSISVPGSQSVESNSNSILNTHKIPVKSSKIKLYPTHLDIYCNPKYEGFLYDSQQPFHRNDLLYQKQQDCNLRIHNPVNSDNVMYRRLTINKIKNKIN